ncbi:hypothetical protein BHQ19_05680 [Mycolicibacterium porcinum]|nr:hypothetical protein BHQ19_05680 [Mycolicibacterium porcinum]
MAECAGSSPSSEFRDGCAGGRSSCRAGGQVVRPNRSATANVSSEIDPGIVNGSVAAISEFAPGPVTSAAWLLKSNTLPPLPVDDSGSFD